MKSYLRFATYVLPGLLTAFAPAVHAGCGDVSQVQVPLGFAASLSSTSPQTLLDRAATAAAALRANATNNAMTNTASIVGLWKLQLTSMGNTTHNPPIPDGASIDFGYTEWHSDGTEMLNSGAHTPASENFCMGTWVRSGYFTYELNHFALSYDPTSGNLMAVVNIHENITLDPSGNEYAGTFTITAFNPMTSVQVDKIVGNVSATRVTVDQITP